MIIFLGMIAGVVWNYFIGAGFALIAALFFLFSGLFLSLLILGVDKRLLSAHLAVLSFLLGNLLCLNYIELSPAHIAYKFSDSPSECFAFGVISSEPVDSVTRYGVKKNVFLVKTEYVNIRGRWMNTEGLCRTEILNSVDEFCYGDKICFFGKGSRTGYNKTGVTKSYVEYLKRKKIFARIKIDGADLILLKDNKRGLLNFKTVFKFREKISRLLDKSLFPQAAAFMKAILIGDRGKPQDLPIESFSKTGTSHILSVSGLHTALIGFMILYFLRLLGLSTKISVLFTILALFVYVFLCAAKIPVVRSFIMVSLCLTACFFERDYDVYSALSLAGIIVMLFNPLSIFDISFILSFSCVFFICFFTPALKNIFRVSQMNVLVRLIIMPLLVSFSVFIGLLPLSCYYFNITAPIGILVNLFVVPMLGLLLFMGFYYIIILMIFPVIGNVLGNFFSYFILLFFKIILVCSEIPFGYFRVPAPPVWLILVYYIALIGIFYKLKTRSVFFKKILNRLDSPFIAFYNKHIYSR